MFPKGLCAASARLTFRARAAPARKVNLNKPPSRTTSSGCHFSVSPMKRQREPCSDLRYGKYGSLASNGKQAKLRVESALGALSKIGGSESDGRKLLKVTISRLMRSRPHVEIIPSEVHSLITTPPLSCGVRRMIPNGQKAEKRDGHTGQRRYPPGCRPFFCDGYRRYERGIRC